MHEVYRQVSFGRVATLLSSRSLALTRRLSHHQPRRRLTASALAWLMYLSRTWMPPLYEMTSGRHRVLEASMPVDRLMTRNLCWIAHLIVSRTTVVIMLYWPHFVS